MTRFIYRKEDSLTNHYQYILIQLLIEKDGGEGLRQYAARLEERVHVVGETLEEKFGLDVREQEGFKRIYFGDSLNAEGPDYTLIYRRDILRCRPLTEKQISRSLGSFGRKKEYRGLSYKIGLFEGSPVIVDPVLPLKGDFGHNEGHPQDRD